MIQPVTFGWLFLAAGLALGLSGFSNQYALDGPRESWPAGLAFAWLSNWTWVVPIAMLAFLFLLFPTGYVRSRRWRPAAWFAGGAFALALAGALVTATSLRAHPYLAASRLTGLNALLFAVSPS